MPKVLLHTLVSLTMILLLIGCNDTNQGNEPISENAPTLRLTKTAAGVTIDSEIYFEFNQLIKTDTLGANLVIKRLDDNFTYDINKVAKAGEILTNYLLLDISLRYDTTYQIFIGANTENNESIKLGKDYTYEFRTQKGHDFSSLTHTISPFDTETNVSIYAPITIIFSKAMDWTLFNDTDVTFQDSSLNDVAFSVYQSNNAIMLRPQRPLKPQESYQVAFSNAFSDLHEVNDTVSAINFTTQNDIFLSSANTIVDSAPIANSTIEFAINEFGSKQTYFYYIRPDNNLSMGSFTQGDINFSIDANFSASLGLKAIDIAGSQTYTLEANATNSELRYYQTGNTTAVPNIVSPLPYSDNFSLGKNRACLLNSIGNKVHIYPFVVDTGITTSGEGNITTITAPKKCLLDDDRNKSYIIGSTQFYVYDTTTIASPTYSFDASYATVYDMDRSRDTVVVTHDTSITSRRWQGNDISATDTAEYNYGTPLKKVATNGHYAFAEINNTHKIAIFDLSTPNTIHFVREFNTSAPIITLQIDTFLASSSDSVGATYLTVTHATPPYIEHFNISTLTHQVRAELVDFSHDSNALPIAAPPFESNYFFVQNSYETVYMEAGTLTSSNVYSRGSALSASGSILFAENIGSKDRLLAGFSDGRIEVFEINSSNQSLNSEANLTQFTDIYDIGYFNSGIEYVAITSDRGLELYDPANLTTPVQSFNSQAGFTKVAFDTSGPALYAAELNSSIIKFDFNGTHFQNPTLIPTGGIPTAIYKPSSAGMYVALGFNGLEVFENCFSACSSAQIIPLGGYAGTIFGQGSDDFYITHNIGFSYYDMNISTTFDGIIHEQFTPTPRSSDILLLDETIFTNESNVNNDNKKVTAYKPNDHRVSFFTDFGL